MLDSNATPFCTSPISWIWSSRTRIWMKRFQRTVRHNVVESKRRAANCRPPKPKKVLSAADRKLLAKQEMVRKHLGKAVTSVGGDAVGDVVRRMGIGDGPPV